MPSAFALAGDFSSAAHKRTTLAIVGVAFGLGGAAAMLAGKALLTMIRASDPSKRGAV